MKYPRGADDIANAPLIGGFGVSEATPNGNLGPVTDAQADLEPQAEDGWRVYQTAWWKWVAPKSGWVRFDLHQTWTNIAAYQEKGAETTLGIFIGEPGNLWGIKGGSTSYPVGNDMPYWDPVFGEYRYPWVGTSEHVLLVDAGRTYYLQAGMFTDTLNDDPTSLTNYVLRISELIAHPVQITLPTVGPLYDAPRGGETDPVVIVGGNDALLRDSSGYVDFSDGGARLGMWMQPAVNHPEWPPPLNARHPGPSGGFGPAWGFRWECEYIGPRTKNALGLWEQSWDGSFIMEGNQGGTYQYYNSLTPWPNLNRREYVWAADEPNFDGDDVPPPPTGGNGDWISHGGWESVHDETAPPPWPFLGWIRGPLVEDRGIVEGVYGFSNEDFVETGEYRYPLYDPSGDSLTEAAKWYQWWGGWGGQPFYHGGYGSDLVSIDPPDWGIWFSNPNPGYTFAQGFEHALPMYSMRLHWVEWTVRWITFEEVKGELTGGQTGDRRAFSDS